MTSIHDLRFAPGAALGPIIHSPDRSFAVARNPQGELSELGPQAWMLLDLFRQRDNGDSVDMRMLAIPQVAQAVRAMEHRGLLTAAPDTGASSHPVGVLGRPRGVWFVSFVTLVMALAAASTALLLSAGSAFTQTHSAPNLTGFFTILAGVIITIIAHECAHGIAFFLLCGIKPAVFSTAPFPRRFLSLQLPGLLAISSRAGKIAVLAVGPATTLIFTGLSVFLYNKGLLPDGASWLPRILFLTFVGSLIPVPHSDGTKILETISRTNNLPKFAWNFARRKQLRSEIFQQQIVTIIVIYISLYLGTIMLWAIIVLFFIVFPGSPYQ
ncbi:hypothetical protein [Corynebacterium ulcerans]|uniref:hypothetical protein n=1 Tax=Corynebacterium ulcerans TaxID=65058 RepID=UPI0003C7AE06|nr:hypothetical protein [Corynebacterium ulcerans]ESU58066.1 hypothetical protein D881_09885 [Corynebacterium ulcerans NCTC 12077]STC82997.1 Zn-dependent proteases [Corynebacterium ulcerans]